MPEYQDFTLGEVLFLATGGRICSPLHRQEVEPMLDLVAYMLGRENVHMLELAGAAITCQPAVLAQHPFLRELVRRIESDELQPIYDGCHGDEKLYQERLKAWLDAQLKQPGQRFRLIPLSDFRPPPLEVKGGDS